MSSPSLSPSSVPSVSKMTLFLLPSFDWVSVSGWGHGSMQEDSAEEGEGERPKRGEGAGERPSMVSESEEAVSAALCGAVSFAQRSELGERTVAVEGAELYAC